jgi:hypothetical protein
MSIANPLWGAPRIHGELLKLGIDIGQTSVAKYMARRRGPPSQGWKTVLNNHADGIAAMDLFVVPTISFRLLYGLLIMGHGRRQILWFGVTSHPTAEWTEFDPQPFHLDEAAAEKTAFKGLAASGWHTAAIAMGLCVQARPFGPHPLMGLGVDDLRWMMPVRPGDVRVPLALASGIDEPSRCLSPSARRARQPRLCV